VKGRVTLVSPALDPGSTTIEVWVEASKPDPALRPGMTINLSITAKTVKDAIVVPASAVFRVPKERTSFYSRVRTAMRMLNPCRSASAHWTIPRLSVESKLAMR